MKYLTLLGDSVLDNSSYTGEDESSFSWLRRFSPKGWEVLLGAQDGGVVSSIPHQLHQIHPLTSSILLSIGGNDAMREKWRLSSFRGRLLWRSLRIAAADFGLRYQQMLDESFSDLFPQLTVCTIYGGDFGEDQNIINTAVGLFNREILRLSSKRGVKVLDLYHLLQGGEFFTFSIEPSSLGSAILAHNFWKGGGR